MNTHGVICQFGKRFNGKPYTRITVDYLKWMVNARVGEPHRSLAEAELKRRGTVTPEMDISGHAIDRASLRIWKQFKNRIDPTVGFHAWLYSLAKKALDEGREISQGKYLHDGIIFVFEVDCEWPVLKSVFRDEKDKTRKGESQADDNESPDCCGWSLSEG